MLLGPWSTIPLNQALREVLLSTIQSRDDFTKSLPLNWQIFAKYLLFFSKSESDRSG